MRLFRAGRMSIENVTAPGYSACPSYNWLKVNGSREGRYEAFYSIAIFMAEVLGVSERFLQGFFLRFS